MNNILVVEDDLSTQRLIARYLRKAGYFVMTANNGRDALEGNLEAIPDLLILDKMMPEMDGFELVKKLKSEYAMSFIRVIMVSACNSADDVVQGLDMGSDDYIGKPFDPKVLLARVRAQLRIKAQFDDLRREAESLKDRIAEPIRGLLEGKAASFVEMLPEARETGPKAPKKWPEGLKKIAERGIREVLFVCRANLVRSPLAEIFFNNFAKKRGVTDIRARSAALNRESGARLKDSVVRIFSKMKINMADYRSQGLSRELAESADLILPMETGQAQKIRELFPSESEKVFVLGSFRKDSPVVRDIADPITGSEFDFRLCFNDVFLSCLGLIDALAFLTRRGTASGSPADTRD